MDALALDVRDGSELSKTTGKSVYSRQNALDTRLTVKRGLSRVIVQVGNELLTYRFNDQSATTGEAEAPAQE